MQQYFLPLTSCATARWCVFHHHLCDAANNSRDSRCNHQQLSSHGFWLFVAAHMQSGTLEGYREAKESRSGRVGCLPTAETMSEYRREFIFSVWCWSGHVSFCDSWLSPAWAKAVNPDCLFNDLVRPDGTLFAVLYEDEQPQAAYNQGTLWQWPFIPLFQPPFFMIHFKNCWTSPLWGNLRMNLVI